MGLGAALKLTKINEMESLFCLETSKLGTKQTLIKQNLILPLFLLNLLNNSKGIILCMRLVLTFTILLF